jgi:hypothetical protein
MNLSRQLGLQNQYVIPSYCALPPPACPATTSMPHTGSFTALEAAAWRAGP